MAAEIACSKLREFFWTEGQRMLREAMTANPGDKLEAQIASAAIALKLPYGSCVKVHQGRCGMRMFLKVHSHYLGWKAEQEQADKAGEILDRLRGLEQSLAELRDRLPAMDRGETDRARGAPARLSLARASS